MTKEDLEQELCAANANRAILYYLIFDELRKAHVRPSTRSLRSLAQDEGFSFRTHHSPSF